MIEVVSIASQDISGELQRIVCLVRAGEQMQMGAPNEKCAFAVLRSIGGLSAEENKKHTKNLADLLNNQLGITPDKSVCPL